MPDLHSEPDRARRSFLRLRPSAKAPPIRPPWSDETRMAAACLRCGDCFSACPEKILFAGEGGFPEVRIPVEGGLCTFCGRCAEVCPAPVFDLARHPAWEVSADLTESVCLTQQGVHCETCRDSCLEAAIVFRSRVGGPALPRIVEADCTGCGACLAGCPVGAIGLTQRSSVGATA